MGFNFTNFEQYVTACHILAERNLKFLADPKGLFIYIFDLLCQPEKIIDYDLHIDHKRDTIEDNRKGLTMKGVQNDSNPYKG